MNGFLAEVMIDAIDLILGENPRNVAIERLRAGKVVTERLLDDHPAPRAFLQPRINQAGLAEVLDDDRKELRRNRQIIKAVAVGAVGLIKRFEFGLQPGVGFGVVKVARGERDVRRELGPELGELGFLTSR